MNNLNSQTDYITPNKLSAPEKVKLENIYFDLKGNIKKIAAATGINYTTVYRYFKRQYKKAEDTRIDKGKSRRLSPEQFQVARSSFNIWFTGNAQQNVKLAVEKVQKENGIKIPQRLAYHWASTLKSTHTLKHYYKDFISNYTPHIRRDLWSEYKNFMDCVVSDVRKIDDFYLNEQGKQCTAYMLTFMDMKTRYLLNVEICPQSVSGADVKKGMLNVITTWGIPKQWYLDNGHEFINDTNINFLYGIHEGVIGMLIENKVDKHILLKQEEKIINSNPYHPQGKGMLERTFRIIKDELDAYSRSYSPNQFDSRKPDLHLSNVKPTHTFEELAAKYRNYLNTDFIERERDMFLDPLKSPAHQDNKNRPRTIKQAFDIAYSVYQERICDPYLLAYHYADKKQATYRNGQISFIDSNSKLKLYYIPNDYNRIIDYTGQKLTVLMDPQNIFHCWIFKDDFLLTEATDMRYEGNIGLTKERATTIGKIQRKVVKLERDRLDKIGELETMQPQKITREDYQFKNPLAEEEKIYSNDFNNTITAEVQEENTFLDYLDD